MPARTRTGLSFRTPVRTRTLIALCALGSALFVTLVGVAIAHYPGGTWFDPHAPGHSFAKNFLCDLMQTRALNGRAATVGAPLARIGVVAMLVAVAALFALVARFERTETRAGRVARHGGALAALMGIAVPFTPSDEFRNAHIAAVLCAFAPALVAAIGAFIVCMRAKGLSPWLRASALVTVGAGGFDGLAYGVAYGYAYARAWGWIEGSGVPAVYAMLPAFQRMATVGLLAWVVTACLQAWRERTSMDHPFGP